MTLNERRELYYWNLTPDAPLCINCKHFTRHYTKMEPPMCKVVRIKQIDCGHCFYPRAKPRNAYDTCKYFQNKYQWQEEAK